MILRCEDEPGISRRDYCFPANYASATTIPCTLRWPRNTKRKPWSSLWRMNDHERESVEYCRSRVRTRDVTRSGRAGGRADLRGKRKTCALYIRRRLEYSPGKVGRHGEVLRGHSENAGQGRCRRDHRGLWQRCNPG